MVPSDSKYSNYNDYDAHGLIIQELRLISRNYKIPVTSITQNTRASENAAIQMSNDLIGDSYKKVRYSDYIYMIRIRFDLDLLSEQVKADLGADNNISFTDMSGSYVQTVTPFEVKITKAKEGKKDIVKFHGFCGKNLRIYDSLVEFFSDIPKLKHNSKILENQVELLGINTNNQLTNPSPMSLDLL